MPPPRVTHKDFKSLVPYINDAMAMDYHVGHALQYCTTCKITTPWEKPTWNKEILQNFNIDLEKVDRLYYTRYQRNGIFHHYQFLGRMDYHGNPLYVELRATFMDPCCLICGDNIERSRGSIFLSRDVNLCLKLFLKETPYSAHKDRVHAFLAQDGIQLEKVDEYARPPGSSVPTLKYLCHQMVYQHRKKLRPHRENLPKTLNHSLVNFFRYKDAEDEYYINRWKYLEN